MIAPFDDPINRHGELSLIFLGEINMVLGLLVVGGLVLAGVVVYNLVKEKKAVTGASVLSGVETEVSTAVSDVKADVAKDETKPS